MTSKTTLKDWTAAHKDWVDEFVLALRDAGMPGARIGDRLAGAHERCVRAEAFPEQELGPAGVWARAVLAEEGLSPRDGAAQDGAAGLMAAFLPVAAQTMIMFVTAYAVRGWILRVDLQLNAGTLACWGLMGVLLAVLPALALRGFRTLLRPVVLVALSAAAVVLGVLAAVLAETDLPLLVEADPRPVAVVGVVLILLIGAAATVLALRRPLGASVGTGESRTGPARGQDAGERAGSRRGRLLGALVNWVIPVYLAVDAGFTAMVGA